MSFLSSGQRSEQRCVDQASFHELCRKVDWLIYEVQNIKRTVTSNEKKLWERESLEHRSNEHDIQREQPNTNEARRPDIIMKRESSDPVPIYERRSSDSREYANLKTSGDTHISQASMATSYGSSFATAHSSQDYARRVNSFTYETRSPLSPTDSPVSNENIRLENIRTEYTNPTQIDEMSISNLFLMAGNMNIVEIILLWERGMKDVPPISKWAPSYKSRYCDHLKDWFKVYHIFATLCRGDIGRFISRFTDPAGHMMTVRQVSAMCPNVEHNYELFLKSTESPIHDQQSSTAEITSGKVYILPRKINGRKVSAKDVIQLWEHGIGDIPPIKSWTKTQKFKQQSKISRWKKIVDIFKYQCNGDMKKFEKIYTDDHGCLLPVAAITSKFETVYGDELNITSKLMTVTTTSENNIATSTSIKRSFDTSYDADQVSPLLKVSRSNGYSSDEEDSVTDRTTSPFFSKDDPTKTDTRKSATPVKDEDVEVTETDSSTSGPFLENARNEQVALKYSNQSSPSTSDSDDNSSHCKVFIPTDLTIKDCIQLWEYGYKENGVEKFPPISLWDRQQKLEQKGLIQKIENINVLYNETFKRDYDGFIKSLTKEDQTVMTPDEVLSKYQGHFNEREPSDSTTPNDLTLASSMTFDFSHHRTISQCPDVLYLLPRKINGRKVNAKDVLQLWYRGLNKIPPVKEWSPQHKAVQQSKISRWKKIVDLFEQEFEKDWEKFEKTFTNSLGQLLPITAIIAKHEENYRNNFGLRHEEYIGKQPEEPYKGNPE